MSLEKLIKGLNSGDKCIAYDCLVALRTKFIKRKDGVALLRQHGGLDSLVNLLKCHKEKIVNITLSILGNCCLEDKTRTKILEIGGIAIIGDVFVEAKAVSICNRSCRTLANLALDEQCCESIHKLHTVVPHIAKTMAEINDQECQQTYLRALRLFSDTAEHRFTVIASNGVTSVSATLKESASEKVILASLKTLTTLTTEMTEDCIQQILSSDILQRLSQLCSEPSAFRAPSLALILAFSQRAELRPALGSTGVIKSLLASVVADKDDSLPVINALCHFCQEAVNRVRVRETGTLKHMLQWLRLDQYGRIHNRLISALVCFLYDEPSMDLLLTNGLVAILVQHLHRCMTSAVTAHVSEKAVVHATETDNGDVPAAADSNDVRMETSLKTCEDKMSTDIVSNTEMHKDLTEENTADAVQKEDLIDCEKISDRTQIVSCHGGAEGILTNLTSEEHQDKIVTSANQLHTNLLPVEDNCVKENSSSSSFKEESLNSAENKGSGAISLTNIIVHEAEDLISSRQSTCSKTVTQQSMDTLPACSLQQEITEDQSVDSVNQILDTYVRYSIDSPTYKTLSDVSFADCYSGPRNIMQSAEYYGRASPHGLYGYQSPPRYSPLSTLSYPSPEWSPESSPLRSVSPVTLEFSPCLPSTSGGGASPMNGASSPLHWNYTEPIVSKDNAPLEWSPVQSVIDDVDETECTAGELGKTSHAITVPSSCWQSVDDNVDNCQIKLSVDGQTTTDLTNSIGVGHVVVDDQVKENESDEKPQAAEASVVEPPDDSSATAAAAAVESGVTTCKRGLILTGRRKRSLSAETMSKIRKIVAASPSHSNVDVSELMTSPASSTSDSSRHYNRHHDPTKMTEHNILVLLSRISYMTDPSAYLVSERTLRGLLNYVATASRPLSRAARILRRLTRNTHCFEPIILTMMPMLIETLLSNDQTHSTSRMPAVVSSTVLRGDQDSPRKPDDCINDASVIDFTTVDIIKESCDVSSTTGRRNDTVELKRCLLTNLSLLSESRYGRGVISHILLTGSSSDKLTCAMSLPFLCRSRELRRKMLLDFSGLELLLKSFATTTDSAFPLAVRSLATLFTSPSIKSNELVRCQQQVRNPKTTQGTSVTFVMDDGSRITALRTLLVQQSSVFAAMLDGHYCESEQAEVRISEVSPPAFRVLVTFIQTGRLFTTMICDNANVVHNSCPADATSGDDSNTLDDAASVTEVESLDVCINVLALANQYLVADLQQSVSQLLCEQHLTEDTVCLLLEFAQLHNSVWLAQKCAQFVFVHSMAPARRVDIARKLMDSEQRDDTLATIKRLLVSSIM